jgi:hypothetical protein
MAGLHHNRCVGAADDVLIRGHYAIIRAIEDRWGPQNEVLMGALFVAVLDFFQQEDWLGLRDDERCVLQVKFQGDHGRWDCYAQVREEQEQFVFYSVCPVSVPPEKRAVAAEFMTRANYGLVVGNLEMDYDDGEIRFKTSIDVTGASLTPAVIRQVVYGNVVMMDYYLPGLLSLLYGNESPEEILKRL